MKYLAVALIVILASFTLAFSPPSAEAHLGGGPPFLFVDGKPAQTNSTYMSLPSFLMPWDLAPDTYLVNTPIKFEIDLTRVPTPLEVAKQSMFRWTWEESAQDTEIGTTFLHTYSTIGSHLVTIEAKGPGETEYTVISSVRINIVPTPGYRLPTVSIAVGRNQFASGKPITFISRTTTDPSTKLAKTTWDFGDNTASQGVTATHTYTESDFLHFAYVQVVDSNGFKAEDGITVSGNKGVLTINSLLATASAVPMVDLPTSSGAIRPIPPLALWLGIGGLAIVILTTLAITLRRRFTR